MKYRNYFKSLFIISLVSSVPSIQSSQPFIKKVSFDIKEIRNKSDAENMMTSVHNQVFGKNNLVTSRILVEEANLWYSFLSLLEKYIEKKDKSLVGGKWAPFTILRDISNNVINTLKINFNTYIAPALKNPDDKQKGLSNFEAARFDLGKLDMNAMKTNLNRLRLEIPVLQDLQKNKLTTTSKMSAGAKEARELLKRLAFTLEVTIDKVAKDLDKIKK